MRSLARCAAALSIAFALSACGTASTPARGPVRTPEGPHVTVGTTFSATLRTPIGTMTSRPGDAFHAIVDEDVRATDGSVVLPAGSTLHGRVVRVGRDEPRLEIVFAGVDVPGGRRAAELRLIHADDYATVGSPDEGADHDAVLLAPIGPKAATGGGPPIEGRGDDGRSPTRHVFVPAGTKLTLLVFDPLR